jgi:hypothetical protein
MRWRGPAVIVNDGPIISSERMFRKVYDRKCSIKKILAVSLKGLRHKDELIGGKPPVVK